MSSLIADSRSTLQAKLDALDAVRKELDAVISSAELHPVETYRALSSRQHACLIDVEMAARSLLTSMRIVDEVAAHFSEMEAQS